MLRFGGRMGRVLAVVLLALGVNGCFYDSRWGEAKRAQARNAARLTPATITSSSSSSSSSSSPSSNAGSDVQVSPPAATRALRMRIYASTAYEAQTIDWQRQVRDLIDDANPILAAALGAHLELDTMQTWDDAVEGSSLEATLVALRAKDSGEGVDWVAGMVGSIPRVTESFHELGMGEVVGKHIVLRAASRLEEHEAVEKAFSQLSEEDRRTIRQSLKRHRAVSVFLHELGHTLGALHETEPRSLMFPQYSRKMTTFSGDAVALMRISVARRTKERDVESERALDGELLAYLRESPGTMWSGNERAQMMARLEASIAAHAPTEHAPTEHPPTEPAARNAGAKNGWEAGPSVSAPEAPAPSNAPIAEVPGLTAKDRERYVAAIEAFRRGDAESAFATATPLFKGYPKILAIQDLRCQIATRRGLGWDVVRDECAPLMKLSTGK